MALYGFLRLHSEIHYQYERTDSGAKIMIETLNPRALQTLHEFLRFQIDEHKTGDSTKVTYDAIER